MFSHNMIPTINKPTRVTRNKATTIVHFITKTVVDTQFKSGIIQTDLSDHFLYSLFLYKKHNEHFVYKRYYD